MKIVQYLIASFWLLLGLSFAFELTSPTVYLASLMAILLAYIHFVAEIEWDFKWLKRIWNSIADLLWREKSTSQQYRNTYSAGYIYKWAMKLLIKYKATDKVKK